MRRKKDSVIFTGMAGENKMRVIVFIISFISIILPLSGQVAKYSNEFLSVGIGARALSMSNSVVATVRDITSGYWNPSGLVGQTTDAQIGLMHAEYFAGIAKYDYGSVSVRMDEKSIAGVSILRFGVDDILNTLDLIDSYGNVHMDRITRFSTADYGFLFSYARTSGVEGLLIGGNLKIIYRKIGSFATAWGFGFDAGARYKRGKWHFGLSARDITSTFNAWSFHTSELEDIFAATGNDLPVNSLEMTLPELILGTAREINLSKKFSLLAELDADIAFDGKRNVLLGGNFLNFDPHAGFELDFMDLIFLRMGMGNFQLIPDFDKNKSFDFQPTLGLGINLKRITIDYALTDIGDQSIALYSNIFSLVFSFNLPAFAR